MPSWFRIGVQYRNLSLKWKLIFTYSMLNLAVTLAVGFSTYGVAQSRLQQDEEDMIRARLSQSRLLFDFNLESYMKKSEVIFYSAVLQDALSTQYSGGIGESVETLKTIYRLVDPIIKDMYYSSDVVSSRDTLESGLAQVIIFTSNSSILGDGALVQSFSDVKTADWVNVLFGIPGLQKWQGLTQQGSTRFIAFNRVLRHLQSRAELGVLSIRVPVSKLRYLASNEAASRKTSLYLVDDQGQALELMSNQDSPFNQVNVDDQLKYWKEDVTSGLRTVSLEGKRYIVAFDTLRANKWRIVGVSDADIIQERLAPIRDFTLIIMIAGIVFAVLIGYMNALRQTKRLEKVLIKIKLLAENPDATTGPIGGEDEIGRLDMEFDRMASSLQSMRRREGNHLHNRAALQTELLQARINPHLLYNTMAAISWKARNAGLEEVREAADELIRFYKNFLNYGVLISRVGEEIRMVETYMKIMRFTYAIDFETVVDVHDDARDYSCPNLFLQPIVENAIVHGIRARNQSGGKLIILGCVEGQDLVFSVSDNGPGMEAETVKNLLDGKDVASTGYGLANIRRRLFFYYGDRFHMDIRTGEGFGCEVLIRFPLLGFSELDSILRPFDTSI